MIAIDTNLLVYAHRRGTAEHEAAKKAIESASSHPRGWGIAFSCIAEFWSIVTHPSCIGGPSKPVLARNFLEVLLQSGAGQIWLPGIDFENRFLRLAEALGVAGPRVFDLQIALIAFENGAQEIWTHDQNFLSVKGLRVYDPL